MSTRSIIVVTGKNRYGQNQTYRLYRHSDGYPTGVLPLLVASIRATNAQCDETIRGSTYEAEHLPIVEQFVGNLIGAATDCYGMSARIDGDGNGKLAVYVDELQPEHFGNQFDLEWIYVVDLARSSLSVYGGGFSGQSPQVTVSRGEVSPESYADQLKVDYQSKERAEIAQACETIRSLGYKFGSLNESGPRKKISSGKRLRASRKMVRKIS